MKISIVNNPLTLTLFFINSGVEFYEDLFDYKKFLIDNQNILSDPDFFILATLLRLWRKNYNLTFIPVEFLDFLIVNYKSELISDTVIYLSYENIFESIILFNLDILFFWNNYILKLFNHIFLTIFFYLRFFFFKSLKNF